MESPRLEVELPNQMAHLNIEMKDATVAVEKVYSLRKKKLLPLEKKQLVNRRINTKHKICVPNNTKEIEDYYLNKNVNIRFTTLETIHEEPKVSNSNIETYVGHRKLKRLLKFQTGSHYTKEKINKRRAKIRKIFGKKSILNRKIIPMDVFSTYIQCVESDEEVQSKYSSQEINSYLTTF